jgi:hypothetical protein
MFRVNTTGKEKRTTPCSIIEACNRAMFRINTTGKEKGTKPCFRIEACKRDLLRVDTTGKEEWSTPCFPSETCQRYLRAETLGVWSGGDDGAAKAQVARLTRYKLHTYTVKVTFLDHNATWSGGGNGAAKVKVAYLMYK